ncbi:ABC transporter substrate binding protein [Clostridium sp. 'White wine YQ']|uniref:ABC transporter substrate binding protein n=1 Tax=Clostridium sp. 'White wine YQ' TaxID=3027474 RepID=UPI0023653699|nr:ABC transporter substrate binding protein [Clostridium sp. 'White wine YQ']MDD7794682.1 ABC transporter substrate binding protein [Clostridium sp. 'White wine YQ']
MRNVVRGNKKRNFLKVYICIFFAAFLLLNSTYFHNKTYAAEREYNVLLINSYDSAFTWTKEETSGIFKTLNNSNMNIKTNVEYMDWKNYPYDENIENFKNQLKYKYSNKKIDLIITTDDAALEFALKNRDEITGNVPIVFCGVYGYSANSLLRSYNNITGVLEKIDTKGTLSAALKIYPETKKIYVINDDTESGLSSVSEINQSVKELNKNLEVISLDKIRISNLEEDLPKNIDNSVFIMTTFSRDVTGKTVQIEDMARKISNILDKPLFQVYGMTKGYGTIGGSLLNGEDHGSRAALMVLDILKGKSTNEIPIYDKVDSKNIFDYSVMQKYKISGGQLPENSTIINKPFSFYESYKTLVWNVLAVILLLLMLITFLIINILSRRKAEKELIQSNQELSDLYEELATSDEELRAQYIELEENKEIIEKTEEMYRLVFETSNDGLWEIDLKTNERFFSDRWYEIFGIPKEKVKDMEDWYKLIHPEDYETAKKCIEDITNGSCEVFANDFRIMDNEGNYKWIHGRGKGVKDANGVTYRIAGSHSDIHDKKVQEEQIRRMAYYDSLTGLVNRSNFEIQVANKIKDTKNKSALIFMDLDNFKNINDSFGHTLGDELIIQVANILKNIINEKGIVGRLGGDEFLILLTDIKDNSYVENMLDEIINRFNKKILIDEGSISTSASFGIALYPTDGDNFEYLLKNADTAMYKAKEYGKRKFVFFEQWMNDDITEMVVLENLMRQALVNKEFTLNFQPKFCLSNDKIQGFEALIRWNSPSAGFISPLKFIPLAEKTGLIVPIGRWVIEKACDFLKTMHSMGYDEIDVSINVSVIQLLQEDFIPMFKSIILEKNIDPRTIHIEITESVLMESIDTNIYKIEELKKMGVKIYLDDFGKGYSSLTYLKDMNFDVLKIDKVFIDEISENKNYRDGDSSIVGTIIKLAHQMGLKVVAEGVEVKEQYDYLTQNKCDYIQGYYISKPIELCKIQELMDKYK